MFIDEIKVYARAGHGGKGCVAFLRETFRPKGGPSGGNGGRGGDVILEADHDLNNLLNQFYQPRLLAENGHAGMGKGMDGLAGKDLVVKVPCGTLVWKLDSGNSDADIPEGLTPAPKIIPAATSKRQVIRTSGGSHAMEIDLAADDESGGKDRDPHQKGELICDLTTHGQKFELCGGGRGGLGNRNFATARRQSPRFAQPGEPGSEGNYLLELRIVGDIGILGYPNAGKSTLLAAISKARPRIAPYPFTTLTPQIGIVEYPDWHRLTVCDVPGLIAGAHKNVGLGHAFLRHIRRCPVLIFLIDMAGTDNRNPWDDYISLQEELELYDPSFLNRPRMVVANKMDEPAAAANLKTFKRKFRKHPVLEISAAFDIGLQELLATMRKTVEAAGKKAR